MRVYERRNIMAVIHLTDADFEEKVLKAEGPVLVDFWATWCGPCKMQGPIIEELAEALPDAKIGKLDVDDAGAIAERYNIMSIPTIVVFKDGEVVKKAVGLQQLDQLKEMLA